MLDNDPKSKPEQEPLRDVQSKLSFASYIVTLKKNSDPEAFVRKLPDKLKDAGLSNQLRSIDGENLKGLGMIVVGCSHRAAHFIQGLPEVFAVEPNKISHLRDE